MLAPPGPIQPHEVTEFGTMCSPASTAVPSTLLTWAAVSSVQASVATEACPLTGAPEAVQSNSAALISTEALLRDLIVGCPSMRCAAARILRVRGRRARRHPRSAGERSCCRADLDPARREYDTATAAWPAPEVLTRTSGGLMVGKLLLCTALVCTASMAVAAPPVDNVSG